MRSFRQLSVRLQLNLFAALVLNLAICLGRESQEDAQGAVQPKDVGVDNRPTS